MLVGHVHARNFRSYELLDVELGPSVTVVTGDNGAGKTNLLEAIYTGCVGRSCRTRIDAQTIRFGEPVTRVEVSGEDDDEPHTIATAIDRREGKTFFADGAKVESLETFEWRPLSTVFMPDRLELVKGAPGTRRAHIDQFIAAIWPARRAHRQSYAAALAQRNALIARGGGDQLDTWDHELARHGRQLIDDRAQAVAAIADAFTSIGDELGLAGGPSLRYRTVKDAEDETAFVERLRENREADAARGYTTFGPHRDELVLKHEGHEVRTYGSQGQQRISLLALLLSECEAITRMTSRRPMILLDDVMSELDATRRGLLVDRVKTLGQVVITTTEAEHVPGHAIDRQIRVADQTTTVVD